jgi:hypothetical protein
VTGPGPATPTPYESRAAYVIAQLYYYAGVTPGFRPTPITSA